MKTPLDNDLNKVYEAFNQNHNHLRQTLMALLPDSIKQHKQILWVAHTRDFIRGTIMKSRMTKLATAAVIFIVILIGVNQFGGSIDIATIAFADISEAMKNMPWMHSVSRGFDNRRKGVVELWIGFDTKINAVKEPDGKAIFWNANENRKYEYDPQNNTITIDYADNVLFPMSSPILFLESMQKMFKEAGAKIITKSGEYRGQKVQIQEISLSSVSPGNGDNLIRLFIEPKSKLLFAAQVKSADSNGNTVVDGETTFHYPQTGPADIYDLGVPRDAKIIRNLSKEDNQAQ